jgi:hypothetical protein
MKFEMDDIKHYSTVIVVMKCSSDDWETFPIKQSVSGSKTLYKAEVKTSAGMRRKFF